MQQDWTFLEWLNVMAEYADEIISDIENEIESEESKDDTQQEIPQERVGKADTPTATE